MFFLSFVHFCYEIYEFNWYTTNKKTKSLIPKLIQIIIEKRKVWRYMYKASCFRCFKLHYSTCWTELAFIVSQIIIQAFVSHSFVYDDNIYKRSKPIFYILMNRLSYKRTTKTSIPDLDRLCAQSLIFTDLQIGNWNQYGRLNGKQSGWHCPLDLLYR